MVPAQVRPPLADRVLIAALRKAHAMLTTERGLPMMEAAPTSPYDRNILRLAFLPPDIQQAILDGRQPHHLNLVTPKSIELPLSWSGQRELLQIRPWRNRLLWRANTLIWSIKSPVKGV